MVGGKFYREYVLNYTCPVCGEVGITPIINEDKELEGGVCPACLKEVVTPIEPLEYCLKNNIIFIRQRMINELRK